MKRFLISEPEFFSHVPKGGGVYRVHCMDAEYHAVLPVSRVLGVDPDGVLYIGKATAFTERVINLKKAISPDYQGQGHICGRRYKNPLYETFGRRFPFERLCVSFESNETPDAAERNALNDYARLFGELPPLNRQG